jgi:hypothetical protein
MIAGIPMSRFHVIPHDETSLAFSVKNLRNQIEQDKKSGTQS